MRPSLAFLQKYALRNHKTVWRDSGPSHGDPGSPVFIYRESCKALGRVEHKRGDPIPGTDKVYPYNTSEDGVLVDESKCNCGTNRHNRRVRETAEELDAILTLAGL